MIFNSGFKVDLPLLDSGATCLMLVCRLKNKTESQIEFVKKVIEVILEQKPNINIGDRLKRPALYYAAKSGNLTAVLKLINYGNLNLDAQSVGGETALMKAAEFNQIHILSALIKEGANKELVDKSKMNRQAINYADQHPNRLEIRFAI